MTRDWIEKFVDRYHDLVHSIIDDRRAEEESIYRFRSARSSESQSSPDFEVARACSSSEPAD